MDVAGVSLLLQLIAQPDIDDAQRVLVDLGLRCDRAVVEYVDKLSHPGLFIPEGNVIRIRSGLDANSVLRVFSHEWVHCAIKGRYPDWRDEERMVQRIERFVMERLGL